MNNRVMKKKLVTEKEVCDLASMIEEKFESETSKIESFIDLFNNYSTKKDLTESQILEKIREIFSEKPILLFEFNKLLPKTFRLPVVDFKNANTFLLKVKERDIYCLKELLKFFNLYKNGSMTLEIVANKVEDLFSPYPDLREEALLFIDHKKLSNTMKKNIVNRNNGQTKMSHKKSEDQNFSDINENSQQFKNKVKESTVQVNTTSNKNQHNPEFHFFENLKNTLDNKTYVSIMKLLHLYIEGILNYFEFVDLCEPFFENSIESFNILKHMANSKIMNRRHHSMMGKPLSELDLSKCERIGTSYSKLPNDFRIPISSGRTPKISAVLNDRLISIHSGSEDDKTSSLKKNHYEENIYKFEEQRYENDLIIENCKSIVSILNKINDEIENNENYQIDLDKKLNASQIRMILTVYKEVGQQILENINLKPKKTLPIIITRLNKKIEDTLNQKIELDKTIKLSFDKYYSKSFDYRSFKFKYFEKKNTNPKAFINEIKSRKKEKPNVTNINILKGGNENCEFYSTISLKSLKEFQNKVKDHQDEILLQKIDINDPNIKSKLPIFRLIFENKEVFRITIYIVIYYLVNSNNFQDHSKIIETFILLFDQIFNLKIEGLYEKIVENNREMAMEKNLSSGETSKFSKNSNYEKVLNYAELSEIIKNKKLDDTGKLLNLDTFLSQIVEKNDFIEKDNSSVSSDSNISLTPSFQSQDNGKTYRSFIIKNESTEFTNKDLFYPAKSQNNMLFYGNENNYIIFRYIYCIYERLNKLYEISNFGIDDKNSGEWKFQLFKFYFVILKSLIHRKLENTNLYEELIRDILGNESYFLFNIDKLITSLIKSIVFIHNDNLNKENLNLFIYEKSRKKATNEGLYFSNYCQLMESSYNQCFRFLYSPILRIMSIHFLELDPESIQRDSNSNYSNYIYGVLNDSVGNRDKDNQSQDDQDELIFLERNIRKNKENRDLSKFSIENNLKFELDYFTKKIQFLKSGEDFLYFNSRLDKKKQFPILLEKSIKFKIWQEERLQFLNKK